MTFDTSVLAELDADRRRIHRHPEEGWTEFTTTYFIVERLRSLGFTPTFGIQNIDTDHVLGRDCAKVEAAKIRSIAEGVPETFIEETGGYTGAVITVDTGRPGPTTVCRFDIDCVCVSESNDTKHAPARDGFASDHHGLMHACGHDGHTAVGLAVAKWLSENRNSLCGKIRLLFQPAEEGTRGAIAMTAKGIVDDANFFISGHVGGGAPLGDVWIITGGMLATSKINVDFQGIPSHAGANPEKGRSALLAAAAATMMIEGITRHSEGDSRISIGVLNAGEGRNVTPVHAHLELETRGVTTEVNEFMEANVRRMVKGVAESYDVQANVALAGKAQTIPVCRDLVDKAFAVARSIPTIKNVCEFSKPTASEDSTIFMNRVVEKGGEAVFFFYGSDNNGHHRSDFDLQVEALGNGFSMFTKLLQTLNAPIQTK